MDITPTDTQLAWAAGLFEGEGCISVIPSGIRLYLSITDRDVIEKFASIVGGNITKATTDYRRTKPLHRWAQGKQEEVIRTLTLLWPYLCERRKLRAIELGYDPT
jgi:hypothetical protein